MENLKPSLGQRLKIRPRAGMRLTPARGTKNTFRSSCEKGRLIAFSLFTQVCGVGKTVEKKLSSHYFLDISLCALVKQNDCEYYKFPAWCIWSASMAALLHCRTMK